MMAVVIINDKLITIVTYVSIVVLFDQIYIKDPGR